MSHPTPQPAPRPGSPSIQAGQVELPARLTLTCPGCGATHTAMALHDEALTRARICPKCDTVCEVTGARPISLGCSCC